MRPFLCLKSSSVAEISAAEEDLRQTKGLETYVDYIFQSPVIEPAILLDELKDNVNKGRVALILKTAIENGKIDKNDIYLKCYLKIFNELSIIKDLMVKENRIYIPRRSSGPMKVIRGLLKLSYF